MITKVLTMKSAPFFFCRSEDDGFTWQVVRKGSDGVEYTMAKCSDKEDCIVLVDALSSNYTIKVWTEEKE